jgi:DNA-binding FadR family transcriptional regulator
MGCFVRERNGFESLSEFLRYLSSKKNPDGERIPPLADLSQELGVSIASLREQLEVARALGLVEVRPKTGIRKLPYSFKPAVERSLSYGLTIKPEYFQEYTDLRNHIEMSYWYQAVGLLTPDDHARLKELVNNAKAKLHGEPIEIPHFEHRELHMIIYRRLDNPFVTGILEAYWEMYEAVGLNVYTDLHYLERVWIYHEKMVDSIISGNFTVGYQALSEHMNLLRQRSKPNPNQKFE